MILNDFSMIFQDMNQWKINEKLMKNSLKLNLIDEKIIRKINEKSMKNQWKINENQWKINEKSMKINENQRKAMKIIENQRKAMKIDENQWKSIKPIKSKKIYENKWKSTKINNRWKSIIFMKIDEYHINPVWGRSHGSYLW